MGVENSYLAVDWLYLVSLPKTDDEFAASLFEAIDNEADWISDVSFGEQIDPYYFESWNGLREFNDWFRERKQSMDQAFVKEFSSLFMDVGLLHKDDTFAPSPINEEFLSSSDWLLASIPPARVADLAKRADAIDLDTVTREFQQGVDQMPCDMVPDGATIAQWVASLRDGLRATVNSDRGIIMGAA